MVEVEPASKGAFHQFTLVPIRAVMQAGAMRFRLDYTTPCDQSLQAQLSAIDDRLRAGFGLTTGQAAAGLLDLTHYRLAMIHPDRLEYAASVPKIGILLAWFQLHPEAASGLEPQTRHELGLMIKASSNELATKYSQALGLRQIQEVLNACGFYDARRGGGLWMGKHYGVVGGERIGDPVGDHSHAATVRQLLRFYLALEQGRLVSPAASRTMRDIFASDDVPHESDKFVRALAGRGVRLLRKSGSYADWQHDTAIITGPGRYYLLVGLTHHARGEDYLVGLAQLVDDWIVGEAAAAHPPTS